MIYAVSDEELNALGERLVGASNGAITHFTVAYGELNLQLQKKIRRTGTIER